MLAPGTADLHAVTNIDYDAKGQRTRIDFGNGVRTTYAYNLSTFRLVNLLTRRPGDAVQDLHYTYDPVGNITHIRDDAQQTVFFSRKRVEPSADYTYDALYRLIEATGREHLGQIGAAPAPSSYNDTPRVGVSFASEDGTAMARYLERYVYDAAGNFETMKHLGTDPANPGWTRAYSYAEPSLTEAGRQSNRLTSTATDPTRPEIYSTGGDGYDAHGNLLRMPHLQEIRWDFKDQLHMTRRQAVNAADADGAQHAGERTWYVYDASGQRVRKVTELSPGVVKDERIYFGGFEIYRSHDVNSLVRETLHIMDDKQRIALVETRTAGTEPGVPPRLIRFQFGNHLGSASLELDDQARVVSYEEYTPYGSTVYQALRSRTETPKRYRYTGKERDEESGFYYHGARYYAPWLGRWTSCDPIGLNGGINLMVYCHDTPVNCVDPDGRAGTGSAATPTLPSVPEVGKHPEGLLAESQFNSQWEAGVEWRYGKGSLAANLAESRKTIEAAADPSAAGRAEYKSIYDRFRRELAKDPLLAKFDWRGTQLHHINPVTAGVGADPGAAADPTGIVFARGHAKTPGTSHNALTDVPENPDPSSVRRLDQYAQATKGRPDGRLAQPVAGPTAAAKPSTPPVAASPAPPTTKASPTPAAAPAPGPVEPTSPDPITPKSEPGFGAKAGKSAVRAAGTVGFIVAVGEEGKDHASTQRAVVKTLLLGALIHLLWRPAAVVGVGTAAAATPYYVHKTVSGTDRNLSEGAAAANPALDQTGKPYQPPKATTFGAWLGF